MKNFPKFIGLTCFVIIAVLAAVIGFSLMSCDNGTIEENPVIDDITYDPDVFNGTWRKTGGYAITIDCNDWVCHKGNNDLSRGTLSSNTALSAPFFGTIILTVTDMSSGGSFKPLPSQYENVKTNTVIFLINTDGNQMIVGNAAHKTPGVWDILEGTYTKGGSMTPFEGSWSGFDEVRDRIKLEIMGTTWKVTWPDYRDENYSGTFVIEEDGTAILSGDIPDSGGTIEVLDGNIMIGIMNGYEFWASIDTDTMSLIGSWSGIDRGGNPISIVITDSRWRIIWKGDPYSGTYISNIKYSDWPYRVADLLQTGQVGIIAFYGNTMWGNIVGINWFDAFKDIDN